MSQQQELSPQQALANLNEVAQKYLGTRQDHVLLEQSMGTLVNALNELIGLRAEKASKEAAPKE